MNSDSVHRLVKSIVDSGEVSTFDEAYDIFSRYGVRVLIDEDTKTSIVKQAILLTVINIASRCFIGNVSIESDDFDIKVPGFTGWTLSQYLAWLNVNISIGDIKSSWPLITFDDASVGIRPWANGWQYGIGGNGTCGDYYAPACVASAGIAVNEAFSLLRSDNPYAGNRNINLSLWNSVRPSKYPVDSLAYRRPDWLWLIGLGHLGQAYAWTLGMMIPGVLPIYLQDIDMVTKSNISTSMLCTDEDIGRRKTRVVSDWLEERGFNVSIIERRFSSQTRVDQNEPVTALFGVDNTAARRVCESAGFHTVIDAGLGSGYRDYQGLRIRTFPGPSQASRLWVSGRHENDMPMAPAYERMLGEGAEQCGVTTLASKAVGAPFVGCVAAAYVISEYMRRKNGSSGTGYIDINLREPDRVVAG